MDDDMKTYTPNPLDTQDVRLPDSLDDLTEQMAINVHETWAQGRIAEGWRYGEQRDDSLKTHPCLVPYGELPESEREYDRRTAIQTLKLILKLGFTIRKEPAVGKSLKYEAKRIAWTMGWIVFVACAGISALVAMSFLFPFGSWLLFVSAALVILCTICWLGVHCRQQMNSYERLQKQITDTELSLYRDSVRRVEVLSEERAFNEQLEIRLETKRKELELAKLEKELKAFKD